MKKIDEESQQKLSGKIDDIMKDIHEVIKKHGFENIALTNLRFGPIIPGSPCSPPPGGHWTWVPDGIGGYKLICQ